MLRDLLGIYVELRKPAEALAAVDLLLVLAPGSPRLFLTRARLYQALGCLDAACADLRRYLDLGPQGRDLAAVGNLLRPLTGGARGGAAPTLH